VLLTIEQVARLLNVGRSTVYELIWAGRLRPVRIGRAVRISRSQVMSFVAELER
jgi:excisionase family DNA binding protein